MIRAHKIKLYPNNKQRDYFKKACGVARFAYNWALNEWVKRYEKGEKVTEGQLRKDLNTIKKEQFPWMLEVTKCAPQLAIKQDSRYVVHSHSGRTARTREEDTYQQKPSGRC